MLLKAGRTALALLVCAMMIVSIPVGVIAAPFSGKIVREKVENKTNTLGEAKVDLYNFADIQTTNSAAVLQSGGLKFTERRLGLPSKTTQSPVNATESAPLWNKNDSVAGAKPNGALSNVLSQVKNGEMLNTKTWTGGQDPLAQDLTGTLRTWDPALKVDLKGNVNDSLVVTTGPSGTIPTILTRANDTTPDVSEPSGTATVVAQIKDAAMTLVHPSGAEVITPLASNGTSAKGKPIGTLDNLVREFAGAQAFVAPAGAHAVIPLSLNLSSTATAPTGVPASVSGTYYIGNLTINANQTEKAQSLLYICLIDVAVSGTYDRMAMSIEDQVFNEGALNDGIVDWGAPPGGNANDEVIAAPTVVRLGNANAPTFSVSFDADPVADTDDARIVAREWYTGSFLVDADGDLLVDDTVYFSLYDELSEGTFESVDMSLGDNTFGQGTTDDGKLFANDDETLNVSAGEKGQYGPDAAGYTWTDNADYDWIEIDTTGTNMSLGDEDGTELDLPFDFVYYNNTYNKTYVCADGWISFNDTMDQGWCWYPDQVPDDTDGYNGPLCFICGDLDQLQGGQNVYKTVGTAPNRMFVVEFTGVPDWASGTDAKTAEIILYETSNKIKMQWNDLPNAPDAVGIENDTGEAGIGDGESGDLWINISSISDGTAYEFYPPGNVMRKEVTIGNYNFKVERSASPRATPFDLNITSAEWFTDKIPFDVSESGRATDTLNYAIGDTNSDGIYDKLDLSLNVTYGVGNLNNNVVNATEGERYNFGATPVTITVGLSLPFTIDFDRDPAKDESDVRITALRYYTGNFVVDSDADAVVDDTYYYVLTDSNSDGAYESVDISFNDQTFGQGNLANFQVGAGEDERVLWGGNVRLGTDIYFTLECTGAPTAGASDFTIANKYSYKGNMTFDADLDGVQDEDLYFIVTDTNSDGIYEALDLSFDPIFGEGNLADGLVTSKPFNDERITADGEVQLGQGMNFAISFDKDPMKDNSDIRITIKVWFKGTFLVDSNNDGAATEQLYYFLSDTDSDGFMESMDLSLGNEVFGEGSLTDGTVANGNDERITKETSLTIGALKFMANFTGSPFGQARDGILKNLDLYEGEFLVDLGKTGQATDIVYFVLSDSDADGLYDMVDLSLGDEIYRQDLISDTYVDDANNDEMVTAPGDIRIGPFVYNLEYAWDPFTATSDLSITSKQWYLGSFVLDADGDGVANETLNFLLSDLNSNGVYDTMDLSLGDQEFGQGSVNDVTLALGNDEQITQRTNLTIGPQKMEARFTPSPNQNIEDAWLKNVQWFTGTFLGSGWELNFAIADRTSDGVYDTIELSTNGLFGEGDNADDYVTTSNDEVLANGDMVIRGTYHYKVLINGTMGGLQDAGLKSIEWRVGRWAIEGMSRSVAVNDADSNGMFDTIHLDMNDDGSYDGPNDIMGGIDGFKAGLIMRYAVSSSNDDGTTVDVVPMNATTVNTNGWKVGYVVVDGQNVGVALSDKDGDSLYETLDVDVNGDGVIDSKGLGEASTNYALIGTKEYRVIRVAPDGSYVKIVQFADGIVGPSLDKSVSGNLNHGKVSEADVGLDLNGDGDKADDLVAIVVDASATGPAVERFMLYLDSDLDGDLNEEDALMLGSTFDMGNAKWKVDSISSDRKQVGLMRISTPAATVTTGPDGTFSLTPPDGTYWIRISSTQAGWGYKLVEDTNTHRGYKVSGTGITNKELTLSQSSTSVSGTVTDMITGEPLEGVTVEVYNSEGKKVVSTKTLSDGSYLLGLLRNYVYDMAFSKDGYQKDDGTMANGTWHGMAVGAGRNDVHAALMPTPAPDILSFVEPAEGQIVSGEVNVRIKVSDLVKVDSVTLTVNDGITWITMAPQSGNEFLGVWNTKLGPDGVYSIRARAMNEAGLRVDKPLSLKVDNNGPLVVFKTASEQYGNVEISVKAQDQFSDIKSMEVRIDGGAWQKMSKSGDGYYYIWSSGPFDSGTHNYEVRAKDSRGNASIYKSKVKVDNTWMLLLIIIIVMLVVLVVVFMMKKKKMAANKPPSEPSAAPKEVPK